MAMDGVLARSRSGRGNVAKTEVHWGIYAGIPMLETIIEVAEATVANKSSVSHLEVSAKKLLRRYNDPVDDEEREVIWGLNLHVGFQVGPALSNSISTKTKFGSFYRDNTELVLLVAAQFTRWTNLRCHGLDEQTRILRFMILHTRLPGCPVDAPINIHPDLMVCRAVLASDEQIIKSFEDVTGLRVNGPRVVADVRRRLLKHQQFLIGLRERIHRLRL